MLVLFPFIVSETHPWFKKFIRMEQNWVEYYSCAQDEHLGRALASIVHLGLVDLLLFMTGCLFVDYTFQVAINVSYLLLPFLHSFKGKGMPIVKTVCATWCFTKILSLFDYCQ